MTIRKQVLALLVLAVSFPAWGCSPPPRNEYSGFDRHEVGRLPKNARGVMFRLSTGAPKPSDFRVESSEDKRPLTLRVHAFKGGGWYRLEPVGGFQPSAHYRFRYLPAHGKDWRYPDQMSVAIDDAVVSTKGRYAIKAAPQPVYRVVTVPSAEGSCVVPSLAIVQTFTYALPSALARYGDALDYDARLTIGGQGVAEWWSAIDWRPTPVVYEAGAFSFGLGYSRTFTKRRNAVVAACGRRWQGLRLHGAVRFPEVDEHVYRTAPVDLNANADGQCAPLEALLQTIDPAAPEPVLQDLCRIPFSGEKRPLRSITLDEWKRSLEFPYGMSPTCDLVAIGYLWRTGQLGTDRQTLSALGTILTNGLNWSEPRHKDELLHALTYAIDQLPPSKRIVAAKQLLAPMQPVLVDMLAKPHPMRQDDLARLLAASR
jgi:hypothetical protein